MKRNLVWMLLGASLLANVFFVGGIVYARERMHDRFDHRYESRIDRARESRSDRTAELDLTAEQRRAFEETVGSVRARAETFRDDMRPVIQAFRDEVRGEAPDAALIAGHLRDISDRRHAMQLEVIDDLEAFMGRLEPEQRRAYIDFARRTPMFRILGLGMRPGPGFGPRRGDGHPRRGREE